MTGRKCPRGQRPALLGTCLVLAICLMLAMTLALAAHAAPEANRPLKSCPIISKPTIERLTGRRSRTPILQHPYTVTKQTWGLQWGCWYELSGGMFVSLETTCWPAAEVETQFTFMIGSAGARQAVPTLGEQALLGHGPGTRVVVKSGRRLQEIIATRNSDRPVRNALAIALARAADRFRPCS